MKAHISTVDHAMRVRKRGDGDRRFDPRSLRRGGLGTGAPASERGLRALFLGAGRVVKIRIFLFCEVQRLQPFKIQSCLGLEIQ